MSPAQLQDGITGRAAIAAIEAEAARRGVSACQLVRSLSPMPSSFLNMVSLAARPKASTIARINAALAGEAPIPPRAYQRRDPIRDCSGPTIAATTPRVSREPCFRCGVRSDIGCGCRTNGHATW